MLRLRLLGGFDVEVRGRRVDPGAWRLRKSAALVKLLGLSPGHALHAETLLEWLWPEVEPDAAANNLQFALHQARRVLDPAWRRGSPILARLGDRVHLAQGVPVETDLADFEAAVARARAAAAPPDYENAIAAYAGELLPADPDEPWAEARRRELRARHLALFGELAALHEDAGDRAAAADAHERVLALDPAREAAHVALMRLNAAAGNAEAVRRGFERLRGALRDALGAEPGPEARRLLESVASPPPLPRPAQPPTAAPPVGSRHNLPHPLTSFVGRATALERVERLVGDERLVTLTGSGGSGKTRLAVEVGRRLAAANRFPDGVWLVELAALHDAALIPQATAAVLGVREQGARPLADTLREALRERAALVILDNAEHLPGAVSFAADLLTAAPRLHLLVTSRGALGLADEALWRVPSLDVPATDGQGGASDVSRVGESEAVRLFVDRAGMVRPGFALTADNANAAAEICRRLDGMPLAIELAAARVRALSVVELAERLDDRFRLLTGGNRAAPPRHRTLHAAVAWSYDLLGSAERDLLDRCSVFADGFVAEAAAAVAGPAAPAGLAFLVDQSLVQADDGRYRLQESIRQFAEQRLAVSGAEVAARDHHVDYFLALAETAEPELQGPAQDRWLARLAQEHANLRAALEWCERRHAELPAPPLRWLRLAGALGWYWSLRGHWAEGGRWLAAALAAAEAWPADDVARADVDRARGKALTGAGNIAREQGDYPRSQDLLGAALSLYRALDDADGIAWAGHNLALTLWRRGDLTGSAALLEEALARYAAMGDRWRHASALSNLGTVVNQQGDMARGIALLEESMHLNRQLGIKLALGRSLNNLGEIYRQRAEYARAMPLYEECLAAWRETGNAGGMSYVLHNLAHTARAMGDLPEAMRLFKESLALRWELGERRGVAMCLVGLAGLAARLALAAEPARPEAPTRLPGRAAGPAADARADELGLAARLFGAAFGLLRSLGASMDPADRAENERSLDAVRRALGVASFDAAYAEGESMPVAQAVGEAMALGLERGPAPAAPAAFPAPPVTAPAPRRRPAEGVG